MKTCEPSLPTLFDETELPLMSSSEAGLARTSPQRVRELAWTEHAAAYGPKSLDWLASFDRDSSSWKTRQACLIAHLSNQAETSAEFSETWPRSGMTRSGIAYRLPPLTRPTLEIAYGSSEHWPTPRAFDAKTMATPAQIEHVERQRRERPRGAPSSLTIEAATRLFPTPTTRDHMPAHTPEYIAAKKAQGHGMSNLNDAILTLWPTPTASRRSGLQSHGKNAILGMLNPTWIEWLQGLPLQWTAFEPSETAIRRSSPKPSRGQS